MAEEKEACALPEFVGTAVLDTDGLVLPSIDRTLLERMELPRRYASIGTLSARAARPVRSSPWTTRSRPPTRTCCP